MRKVISIFTILILFIIPKLRAQENGKGTILIHSLPHEIRVLIKELDFKEYKSENGELILYNVPSGDFKFKFVSYGSLLKTECFLPENDTLAIYVNYLRDEIYSTTTKTLEPVGMGLILRDLIIKSFKLTGDSSFIQLTRNDGIAISGLRDYGHEEYQRKYLLKMAEYKNSQKEEVGRNIDGSYYIVEEMPLFNGGDPSIEFHNFINQNLRYPEEAGEKGNGGRIIVQFAIDSVGRLVDAKIVVGDEPLLNQEALRVVSSSPFWTPGKQFGKPVKVLYTFPVKFILANPIEKNSNGTILLYSRPADVKISIKELSYKEKKKGIDPILISDVPEGNYTFKYRMEGYKLEENYFLPANDTLTVLADFYQMGVVSVLSQELDRIAKGKNNNEMPILEKPILLNPVSVATFSVLRDSRSLGPPDLSRIPKPIANKMKSDTYQELDSLTASSVGLDELPLFNGQNPDKFREFLAKTVKFPNDAAQLGESGRVEVLFSVDINGYVVDAIVVNEVSHPTLGQEALRVVRLSPLWEPGIYNGEKVKVVFSIHFDFEDLGTIDIR